MGLWILPILRNSHCLVEWETLQVDSQLDDFEVDTFPQKPERKCKQDSSMKMSQLFGAHQAGFLALLLSLCTIDTRVGR